MKYPVVAIVTPGSFVIPSATSSSVELVVEQVAPYLTREVRPIIFGRLGRRHPAKDVRSGVRYVRVPAPSSLRYIEQVSRKLKVYRPKLIQVENRPRFVRYLRRQHPGARIWLSLHSVTFVSRPHIGRAELRSCLDAADRIIVNSHFLKEELIRRVPQVQPKVIVNHLGVNAERFYSRWSEQGAAARQKALAQLGLAGKKVVLYVGRLINIKGVHHLLNAMPQLADDVPDAVLVVVGSAFYGSGRVTPYVARLHEVGSQMPDRIRFIPYVPHSSIDYWFRMADVLVVPSNVNEAFGLVNVEAMASGVPVVATRAGGMPEIIEHETTGFLIDPLLLEKELASRITTLLTQDELARRMGEQSVLRVRDHFTWEKTADRYLELYKAALSGTSRRKR